MPIVKIGLVPPIRSLTVAEPEEEVAGAGFDIVQSEEWDPKNAVH